MTKGINKAFSEYNFIYEDSGYKSKKCVFISHKSEDIEAAKALSEIITSKGIDVYLDINDSGLQSATRENDAKKIVNCIEKALSVSSHILVLVTSKTKQSWWVPYEIGYSKKGEKQIASILLKDVADFPDFLQIEKKLRGLNDLQNYIREINPNQYFEESVSESLLMEKLENKALNYIRR